MKKYLFFLLVFSLLAIYFAQSTLADDIPTCHEMQTSCFEQHMGFGVDGITAPFIGYCHDYDGMWYYQGECRGE